MIGPLVACALGELHSSDWLLKCTPTPVSHSCAAHLLPSTVISKLISCTDSPQVPTGTSRRGDEAGKLQRGTKKTAEIAISNLTPSLTSDEP